MSFYTPALPGLMLVLALSACHSAESGEGPSLPAEPWAPEVELYEVQSAALVERVTASGVAMAASAADLASPAGAVVAVVEVNPGDSVVTGQPLVRYRSARVSMARLQAENSALAAQTQAQHAAAELARLRPLAERGSIPSAQLDELEAQVKAAEAQAAAANSAARSASAAAGDLVVRAPFDGVVTAVHADVGETATGGPAVRVADLRTLELKVAVPERELPYIQSGGRAEIRFPNLDRTAEGTVSWVAMEIDTRSRSAEVVATLSNPDLSIPSGAYAEATLHCEVGREGLAVPAAAVMTEADSAAVWVVADGQASRQPVEVRPLSGDRVEIVSGLRPGQRIVARRTSAVGAGPVRVAGGEG